MSHQFDFDFAGAPHRLDFWGHQFDAMTYYCVICGAAKLDAEARSWECVDPEASKVSAISHIVRGRRLRAIVEKELCRG